MPRPSNNCRDSFCRIEAGTFIMGTPRDEFAATPRSEIQVEVTLTRPFLMAQTEVTRAQWASVGWKQPVYVSPADGPSKCTDPECPVDTVTFFDAVAFANRYSELGGFRPCYTLSGCSGEIGNVYTCTSVLVNADTVYECEGYRLPTEAEWEYAARAGTTTGFYSGDIVVQSDGDRSACRFEPNLVNIGWYCFNSGDQTHAVQQKLPNDWGLFDMSGNAYEYCNDIHYGGGYGEGPLVDPIGSFIVGRELVYESQSRVIRGGSYFTPARSCKTGNRMSEIGVGPGIGFRLVRTMQSAADGGRKDSG